MALINGPGDPGDETPERVWLDPLEPACDPVHLEAGMHALAYYITQKDVNPPTDSITHLFWDIEIVALKHTRMKLLDRAIDSEARYQNVSGGRSGVL
jgi:hypothetical protein